jgi:hypothetical protein
MMRKTILLRTLILSLLVVLLIVGLTAAGCGGRVSPTPAPPPTSPSEAAPVPTSVSPSSAPPLVVASFDNCTGTNDLGGAMGAAYNSPDSLKESYPQEPDRGCVARLEFKIAEWSAFWMKLQGADLSGYSRLVFDVKADPQPGIPRQMKLELKRGGEVSILYVSVIGADWKTVSVNLADFEPAGYGAPFSSWRGVEELVFTFEAAKSGPQGVMFLDNLTFVP